MIQFDTEIGGRALTIQTGKIARQAAGSVLVTYGETAVIVAVNAARKLREGIDFFPLQVEYRERHYASGKIPGGFFKREARPSEQEILTCRLTDRPIRPLFPKAFKYETQVIITVLASDGENLADILAGIGASAALMISNIPWNGPIATVRVGLIDDEFVINPTRTQMNDSRLELIVSGNDQSIVMIEGEAGIVAEETIIDAVKYAHENIKIIIDLQKRVIEACDVVKRDVPEKTANADLEKAVVEIFNSAIPSITRIVEKQERENAISDLFEKAALTLEETYPDSETEIKAVVDERLEAAFRDQILLSEKRADGRPPSEIRPITIDPGFLPRTHGSVLFTRGETQALAVVTLGSKRDEQIIDTMDEDYKKNYMLHYNFPPYSVGETGRVGFTSRREIGHGNLAERALRPILPDYNDFPYTIRIVSEIMESNGSSSMATVCAGSLVLMEAGACTKEHVAGIAMGLIKEGEKHVILSDIIGMEDHFGDMDCKVVGTKDGITAIQLDLKIEGISFDLLADVLVQAKEGRLHILNLMNEAIPEPKEMSKYAPRIKSLQINTEKIGALIGPGGKTIRKIIADTECEIDVDDNGIVTVVSPDVNKCNDAIELIKSITMEPEVGMEFDAIVTRLMTFGAFVEFAPGREGLVHISELNWERTARVEDVVKPGDTIKVKLKKVDDQGRYDFSRKALLPKPDNYQPSKSGHQRSNRPFKKRRY